MALGTSWSDPGAKQRGFTQPSFRGFPRRVSPYGQGISRYGSPTLPHGGGPYYGNQAQQLQQAGADAMSGLAQAVTSYKKNKMYDALLQQEAPELAARYAAAGLTGEPAYQQYQDDMGGQRQDTQDYYTNKMNDLKIQAMQNALNQPGGIQPPVIDPNTGMIWNGRQWVHPDRSSTGVLHVTKPQNVVTGEAEGVPVPWYERPTPIGVQDSGDTSGETPISPASQSDQFVVGQQYRDANGNIATYQGNGQWQ